MYARTCQRLNWPRVTCLARNLERGVAKDTTLLPLPAAALRAKLRIDPGQFCLQTGQPYKPVKSAHTFWDSLTLTNSTPQGITSQRERDIQVRRRGNSVMFFRVPSTSLSFFVCPCDFLFLHSPFMSSFIRSHSPSFPFNSHGLPVISTPAPFLSLHFLFRLQGAPCASNRHLKTLPILAAISGRSEEAQLRATTPGDSPCYDSINITRFKKTDHRIGRVMPGLHPRRQKKNTQRRRKSAKWADCG